MRGDETSGAPEPALDERRPRRLPVARALLGAAVLAAAVVAAATVLPGPVGDRATPGVPDPTTPPPTVVDVRSFDCARPRDRSTESPVVSDRGARAGVVGHRLDRVARRVRRQTSSVPGFADLALLHDAGAVLLQWQAPVPPPIAALAGTRPGGVRVVVEPVRYSRADVALAQSRLQTWLRTVRLRDSWSSSYACADGAGLVVGMLPPVAGRAALQAEMAEAVGMPVRLVAQQRAVRGR